jgi:hypothetical protein
MLEGAPGALAQRSKKKAAGVIADGFFSSEVRRMS